MDESWLNGTRFVRRIWAPAYAPATVTDKQVQPRISLLVALDTDGRIWCALTQANTDSDVMTLFLQHLVRHWPQDPLPQRGHQGLPRPLARTRILAHGSFHFQVQIVSPLVGNGPEVGVDDDAGCDRPTSFFDRV